MSEELVLSEEFQLFRLVGGDRALARLPVRGADLALMGVSVLKGFDETLDLIDGATDLIVVHLHGANNSLGIDDEEASDRCTIHIIILVVHEHAVVGRDLL